MLGNPYSGSDGDLTHPPCAFTSDSESAGYQSAGSYSSNFAYHNQQVNDLKHHAPVGEV